MRTAPKIIVALDFTSQEEVMKFLPKLSPQLCNVKIGLRLFIKYGPSIVEKVMNMGYSVFLDLKIHDIPSQVEASCRIIANMGVWMTTIHALGGITMCTAASNAMSHYKNPPKLIGVTVLTSTDQEEILKTGINTGLERLISKLGILSEQSGLDGIVCSALDIEFLKKSLVKNLLFITPGIRFFSSNKTDCQDQKRTTTPEEAMDYGSNYLVIGRPVLKARDPANTVEEIYNSLNKTMS